MKSQLQQKVNQYRAEGEGLYLSIIGEADKQVAVLLADARQTSERTRGEGDAERNKIYASAYNRDAEFFSFYRSLQAYENSIAAGTPLVISPDSDFFKYKPVAALFCLRAQKTLHAWFVAHDPKFSDYSPGLILFTEAIKAAAAAGYTEMDLGPGDYRFKESFASWGRPIGAGFIGRRTLSSASRAAQFQVRALVEGLPIGKARQWPAKAMRRLDISRGLSGPTNKAA
jgi:hypothetical protein